MKLKTAYQFCSPLKFIIKLYEIGLIIMSLNTWGNPAGDKDVFKYCSRHQIHVFKIDVKKHPLITTADVRSFDRNNTTVYYELTSLYVRLGYE